MLIPQVLEKGEVKIVKNGKGKLYTLEKDGVKYKVYTEIKKGIENFCDFYTNRKGIKTSTSTSHKEASNKVENTQLSARDYDYDTLVAANVAQSPDTSTTLQRENAEIPSKDAQISESSNGGTLYSEGGNQEEDLEAVNARFNERILSLRENPGQKNRVVSLGRAGYILQSGEIADAEIILEYDKFVRKSKEQYKNNHPFDVDDILNLPL